MQLFFYRIKDHFLTQNRGEWEYRFRESMHSETHLCKRVRKILFYGLRRGDVYQEKVRRIFEKAPPDLEDRIK